MHTQALGLRHHFLVVPQVLDLRSFRTWQETIVTTTLQRIVALFISNSKNFRLSMSV